MRSGYFQKPAPGVQINWGHPLTQSLRGCYLFNQNSGAAAQDLVTGRSAIANGSSLIWHGNGPVTGNGTYLNLDNGPSITGSPYSFAFRVSEITASGNGAVVSMNNSTIGSATPHIRYSSTTNIRFGLYFDDLDATIPSVSGGRVSDVVALLRRNNSQEVYEGGILRGSRTAGAGTYTATSNRVTFGAQSWDLSSSGNLHTTHHCYIYSRALSADEARWLTAEPYDFFTQSPVRRYFIPLAVASYSVHQRRRISKPSAGARLNYSHPLTQGLVFGAFFNEGAGVPQDIAQSPSTSALIGSGCAWGGTNYGIGLRTNGASTGQVSFGSPSKLVLGANEDWSVHVAASIDGGNGTARYLVVKDFGSGFRQFFALSISTSNTLAVQYGGILTYLVQFSGPASAVLADPGRLRRFTFTRQAGGTSRLYVDGVQIATSADSTAIGDISNNENFATEDTQAQNPSYSTYDSILVWRKRLLQPEEVRSLRSDPYEMLAHARYNLTFSGGGGGGVTAPRNRLGAHIGLGTFVY